MNAPNLPSVLATDLGVDPNYRHIVKQVTVLEPLYPTGSTLKWYCVFPQELPIPHPVMDLARNHVSRAPLEARGLGFAILHRCGNSFYFLIVSTWRGSNEIWETVFYKDGDDMTEFALFPREAAHKPTYCVWELVPVWHEQQAWVRFLRSDRNQKAAETWLRDTYEGIA